MEPRFRNRDMHGELLLASAAVADAISKSRFLSAHHFQLHPDLLALDIKMITLV